MSDTKQNLSMIELAEAYLREENAEKSMREIIEYVFTTKQENIEDAEKVTRFYMDITTSAKFVFCGEDKWDLKENNLDLWDKDGHAFVTDAEIVEEPDEEDLDFTEFNMDDINLPSEDEVLIDVEDDEEVVEDEDLDEEEKEALKEEEEYIDVEISMKSTDDDDVDIDLEEEYDEDDYNEIMDDYEDMYED